ncbi:Glycosyl transferase, family 4, conserved region [Ammonifex degensii KC4]|uniref:Glycosyl transferase, family 4, conserved region n=1 Tax=Ammonifex degensii (strain DSM 10501 / KC4) TaxID=429009 RepID=C9R9S1_AMMDK|nr:Glycosyl transferase, family 4, conserved region [Ammonifex degensii KC4]
MDIKLICALGVAAAATGLTVPLAIRLAPKLGAMDEPDERKVHSRPMPRLGGLAIFIGVWAGWLVAGAPAEWLGLLIGATLVFLWGLADDIRGLNPWIKLLGQILAAAIAAGNGVLFSFVGHPLHEGQVFPLDGLAFPLTVFWLVAVTNAVNLIDGLDGLAAGVGSIAGLTLAAAASLAGSAEGIGPALVISVCLLAFLPFNFHPARTFLGDCGSMFAGFFLAGASVLGVAKTATAVILLVPVVILGIPLFDTFFAILRRVHSRRHIFRPDREHLHHRLLIVGFSHRGAVLFIYAVSALLGLTAVLLTQLTLPQGLLLLAGVATLLFLAALRLGVIGKRWVSLKRHRAAEDVLRG